MMMSAVTTALTLLVPLILWRLLFPTTDWAIAWLIPLAWLLFFSVFTRLSALYRLQIQIALCQDSPHTKWFSGRFRALMRAGIFTIIATPVLAWQALRVDLQLAVALLVLCVLSGLVSLHLSRRFQAHLTPPYAQMVGMNVGSVILLVIFIPALGWFSWTYATYPVQYLTANLGQAALIELQHLPQRASWVAEFLSIFYVIESSKLWLAIQLGTTGWAGILFSLDTALVAIIIAQASANLALYYNQKFSQRAATPAQPDMAVGNPPIRDDASADNPMPVQTPAQLMGRSKAVSRSFWGTIIALFVVSIGLSTAAYLRGKTLPPPSSETAEAVELPATVVARLLTGSAGAAYDIVAPELDAILDDIYTPVYAAIPAYASFHYSVYGEYTELIGVVFGDMTEQIRAQLYAGFEDRLTSGAQIIDSRYLQAYTAALADGMAEARTTTSGAITLGPLTQTITADAISRVSVAYPIAAATAAFSATGVLTTLISGLAQKLAAKVAAKAAVKGVAKGGGVLVGAGTGAALCSWSGPGAILCGAGGALVAWFAVDAAIVNIDEYFNRDEFEAELRQLIDEDRAEMHRLLDEALQRKALELGANEERFTLHQLDLPRE